MHSAATSSDDHRPDQRAASLGQSVAAGLEIAIIGSVVLALAEGASPAWGILNRWESGSWRTGLIAAAVGRTAVTHALLWCPVLLACAVLQWVILRKKAGRAPEPLLAGLFVAGAGLIVVPTDLSLADVSSAPILVGSCAIVLLLASATRDAMRAIGNKLGVSRCRRIARAVTCMCVVVVVVSGVALARSPLFNPATYRVPRLSKAPASNTRPNVLWIVLDTVRADRMSCYGYPARTTPFLEEWADKSIVFDRAVANGMWTVPSHASMFTGLSVRAHGTGRGNYWLDDASTTVAEVLQANGYATALFSANPWVSPDTNLAQGFEFCRLVHHARRLWQFSLGHLCEVLGVTPCLPWLDPDNGAAIVNELVRHWLDAQRGEAPFFALVNYMEVHLPYRVPKSYRRMYLTDREVDRSYDLRRRVHGCISRLLQNRFNVEGGDFLSSPDRELLKRQHDAAIRYLDDRVSELIRIVEQRGALDNALVVITSDHGEHLDTHGMWAHAFLTYEDLAHIPLLVREPGRQEGLRVSTPVQLTDIYGTVLHAALGTTGAGPGWGARDLVELADTDGVPRVAVTEYEGPDPKLLARMHRRRDTEVNHCIRPQIALQDGRLKYIASGDGRRELYDLIADPGERHNLIESRPAEAQRLALRLREWLDAVPPYQPTRRGAAPMMSPEDLQELRSLGYVVD